jgi:small subunit ribosomal protein S2
MRRFIFGERDGIYIIDLLQTEALLEQARRFAADLAARGGTLLFVGTKKQARDAIQEVAEAADMPYVNHRWLGGLLTNWGTISQRIARLHDLERYESEGQLQLLPTRERMAMQADLEKLRANLGGVKEMQRVPDAVFVIDLKTEAIAVREAQRLRLPIIGLVDTNCDPDGIEYVIPGNDDAIRSCSAITKAIGDVVAQGHRRFRAEEERARREAEEQERREAEERARREEEEARREAEAAAAAEQAEQAAAVADQAAAAAQTPAETPSPPEAAAETPSLSEPPLTSPQEQFESQGPRVASSEDEVPAAADAPDQVAPEAGSPETVEVPPASAPQPPEGAEAPSESATEGSQ